MRRFISILGVILLTTAFASAQQQPVPAQTLNGNLGYIPEFQYYVGGFPVYGPSNLQDNGAELLYKGAPVGGSLPYPGVVYGTSATAGTVATSAQIATALSATPSPVTVSSLTTQSDGVHAGYNSLVGNTAAPAVVANTAGFMGPNSGSFTGYALQLPATNPAAGQAMTVSAPVSGVAQVAYTTLPGSVVAKTTDYAISANKSPEMIFTLPAAKGHYQVCLEAGEGQAATTSSVFPSLFVEYVSQADGVTRTLPISTAASTANTTAVAAGGCAIVYANPSSTIQYSTTGYTSSGATAMNYYVSTTVQFISAP